MPAKVWNCTASARSEGAMSEMQVALTAPGATCPAAERLRSHCAAKGSISLYTTRRNAAVRGVGGMRVYSTSLGSRSTTPTVASTTFGRARLATR